MNYKYETLIPKTGREIKLKNISNQNLAQTLLIKKVPRLEILNIFLALFPYYIKFELRFNVMGMEVEITESINRTFNLSFGS